MPVAGGTRIADATAEIRCPQAMCPHARSSHRPTVGSLTEGMLSSLLEDTLDPAYAEAAERRRGSAGGRWDGEMPSRWGGRAVGAVVVVVGLVLGVAYADTRAEAPSSERARQALLVDVQQESDRGDELRGQLATLQTEVSLALDAELVATEEGRLAAEQVRRLESAAGVVPVSGPGLLVTVSDAATEETVDPVTGDPVQAVPEAGLVLDIDLQAIVNALWAAGAEAVAVDGQRLSPTTSIRTAGEAILVDFRPVDSPYLIEAIGNPDQLAARFAATGTPARYQAYGQLYGIGFELTGSEELRLDAAGSAELRYAGPESPPAVGENK